jgi:hypothetical protein
MLKGTQFWPKPDFWKDKNCVSGNVRRKAVDRICAMSIAKYRRAKRVRARGWFTLWASAWLHGRGKSELDDAVLEVVSREFASADLPIVTIMDFGHTDPPFILPLGIKAQLDFTSRTFRLTESVFSRQWACMVRSSYRREETISQPSNFAKAGYPHAKRHSHHYR